MEKIYHSITELVGHTPLLEIRNYTEKHGLGARIVVKLEYYNPNQSVKDRIALRIIEDAEKDGTLTHDKTIVEITSGNTGIGLAAIAAAKGYRFKTYVQDNVSEERFKVIKAFGGETAKLSSDETVAKKLEETNGDFFAGMFALEDVIKEDDSLFYSNQGANPANPQVHFDTTGPEIWEDTDGKVDILVACVGTGGTVSGTGRFLKSKNPDIRVVAIQPGPGSVASEENPEPEEITGVHPFEDIPEQYIPKNLDRKIYDERFLVETEEAYSVAREVARTEGILVGTSSAAAIYAATKLAERPENKGKLIVAILPDTGLRYLSTNLFEK